MPFSDRPPVELAWKGILGETVYSNPWWPQIMERLTSVCDRLGEYTPLDIIRAVWEQRMQLWIVHEVGTDFVRAVVVTEITEYPSLKTCTIVALVGEEMSEWLHYLEKILEPWAREQGCLTIRGWCREGLRKSLGPRGWEIKRTLLEKKL